MITRVDERLRREARDFSLRFSCESCAAFDAERGCCAHGYPNGEHLGVQLATAQTVVFCKEFELA